MEVSVKSSHEKILAHRLRPSDRDSTSDAQAVARHVCRSQHRLLDRKF